MSALATMFLLIRLLPSGQFENHSLFVLDVGVGIKGYRSSSVSTNLTMSLAALKCSSVRWISTLVVLEHCSSCERVDVAALFKPLTFQMAMVMMPEDCVVPVLTCLAGPAP